METRISKISLIGSNIILLLLFGCGKASQHIDPAFTSYVNSFESDASQRGINLAVSTSIEFGDSQSLYTDETNVVAVCQKDNKNLITVDQTWWNTADSLQRQLVIYHELGHCVLNRVHKDNTVPYRYCNHLGMGWTQATCPANEWISVDRPISIMHSSVLTDWDVNEFDDNYLSVLIDELFGINQPS